MTGPIVMMCDVDLDVPDGARTHTVEVAAEFARHGDAVALVARGADPQRHGVSFRSVGAREHDRLRLLLGLSLRAGAALYRERGASRRFYVRHKWTTLPATLVARCLGYSVVTEVDDLPFGPTFAGDISRTADLFKRGAVWVMGRLSHGVVAGTDEVRQLLSGELHVPRERIAVIPIGVDVEFFAPLDRAEAIARRGLDPAKRYLLFVGHFAPWVDFETMLDGVAQVVRRHPDVQLLMVGDGNGRSEVEAALGRLEIRDHVQLYGYVHDRQDVRDLLAASHIALASHRGEHLDRIGMNATKLKEYLAAGRPVVAKDVAGLRGLIEDPGAGRVANSSEEYAAAIVALLDPQANVAAGAVARRLAEDQHSWTVTVQRTLELFGPPA